MVQAFLYTGLRHREEGSPRADTISPLMTVGIRGGIGAGIRIPRASNTEQRWIEKFGVFIWLEQQEVGRRTS